MDFLLIFGLKAFNHENGLLPLLNLWSLSVALLHNVLQAFSETSIGLGERKDLLAKFPFLHKNKQSSTVCVS